MFTSRSKNILYLAPSGYEYRLYCDRSFLRHMHTRQLDAPISAVTLKLAYKGSTPYIEVKYYHPKAATGVFYHKLFTLQGIAAFYRMAKRYGWKIK